MVGIVSLECNYAPVQKVQEKAVQLMATIVSFLRSQPLHPLVALFCPSSPPDVADHTDAEELPVLVSIQLFWFLAGLLFWSVYYLSASEC